LIEAISLSKSYSGFKAVSELGFRVDDGVMYAFLGPNGAGKTTTIKMLTGILTPDSGDALINGISITKDPVAAKRNCGYLPDVPMLFEKLTGRQYLNFMMDIFEIPAASRRERTEKLIESFELGPHIDSLIESYSLGTKKKIGIVAACCHKPPVLFLDEPTSGLDPQSVRALKDTLKEMTGRGVTVFFSTHILEVAEKICDRVAIIGGGRLVAEGSVAQIRAGLNAPGDGHDDPKSLEDIFLELTARNPVQGESSVPG